MARITDTTPVPVPRTFTVELDETELALLVLVLGKTTETQRYGWVNDTLGLPRHRETTRAANILSRNPKMNQYALYAALRDGLNA